MVRPLVDGPHTSPLSLLVFRSQDVVQSHLEPYCFCRSVSTLMSKLTMMPTMNASIAVTAGIHLPQAGPAASGEAMRQAAVLAEELGYSDVWVSDHVAVPTGADYPPSAYVFEPLVALTWVAAYTKRVGLGTTVLVLPMRNPLIVAKMVASLDHLSGGRVILGIAAGWLEAEFNALGVPFAERGQRTDEAIDIMRRVWTDDHITADYPVHNAHFVSMRTKPQPQRHLPLWIGGHADVALRRAIAVGDGWHGAFLSPEQTARRVKKLRAERPESSFPISMRTRWDALDDDNDLILAEIDHYREVGVTHFVPEPRQRTIDGYLRAMEMQADLFRRAGVMMVD
ncbi:MAG: TIGR03619 family F420-dependent LLM class oxidoreductase [Actinobacteria bacterium]|nr:TIGR03619 family F420-dependent LLM class oxidoreductase [Actinomycetota bacterium]MSZ99411.1 TIGR03619 family F420-dependent LLM class oxidoreductase [Actinomycetota bacterium]MTA10326.1 TIGR03619 family F420-dependent LLM class oxidoreductase [Actinomycetota bacterium]MTA69210.1 TIGR03619 family F420-dependent LLM class oxidoreductase [Actinomycetota bacterium]